MVNEVKANIGRFEGALPPDVQVSFQFDQSGYVRNALTSLIREGALGALLTGLIVFLFLREWKSSIIVVLFIPFCLVAAVVGLWLSNQTINIMTLGGLALAVGILVDEATVELKNIHTNRALGLGAAHAALEGTKQTYTPRFLAMVSMLAVFAPSLLMTGISRSLFVPLSLAVGFAMIASFVLSNCFVPILYVWTEKGLHVHDAEAGQKWSFAWFRERYVNVLQKALNRRRILVAVYLAGAALILFGFGPRVGREIFPRGSPSQFQLRLRAPAGTRLEETEKITLKVLDVLKQQAGPENVENSLGYVGSYAPSYPMNLVYLWTSGPQDAVLLVQLKKDARVRVNTLEEQLRLILARDFPDCSFTFEAGDIVSQIMDFGSPTPIEVAVNGIHLSADHPYAEKVREQLQRNNFFRDIHYGQPLEYPSLNVNIDRVRAGQLGLTVHQIAQSVETATWSSRFVSRNFWQDPNTGIGYQVQVEVPQQQMKSIDDLASLPLVEGGTSNHPDLGDVAQLSYGTVAGEYDRYNMQRRLTLQANVVGEDLGRASSQVDATIRAVGPPPRGVTVQVLGQLAPLHETFNSLELGVTFAIIAIFLLLAANFESVRLAFAAVSTVPAILSGVVLMLFITGTTLNLQSFMGSLMALGVGMANSILLVTFAEEKRRKGANSSEAAVHGGRSRLRAILMTSFAMIAGTIPMALGLGEGGGQSAPLGRAVIGGLAASVIASLIILPAIFAMSQEKAATVSASLDPTDPESPYAAEQS